MFDFDQFQKDLIGDGFVWSARDNYLVKSVWNGKFNVVDTYTPNEQDGSYLHQQFNMIGGAFNKLIQEQRIVCTFSWTVSYT